MLTRSRSVSQKDIAGCKPDGVANRMKSTEITKRWKTCKRVIHGIFEIFFKFLYFYTFYLFFFFGAK